MQTSDRYSQIDYILYRYILIYSWYIISVGKYICFQLKRAIIIYYFGALQGYAWWPQLARWSVNKSLRLLGFSIFLDAVPNIGYITPFRTKCRSGFLKNIFELRSVQNMNFAFRELCGSKNAFQKSASSITCEMGLSNSYPQSAEFWGYLPIFQTASKNIEKRKCPGTFPTCPSCTCWGRHIL